MKKIALCGASGSGKSTLARWISEEFKIPYMENSAGLILPPEVQDRFVKEYGWTKSGHRDVIRLGNIKPEFGIEFQQELLKVRANFIKNTPAFIFDRSPVDNLTYFLLQCGHLADQFTTAEHVQNCIAAAKPIEAIIFLHTNNLGEVEDNGSRVSNWFYQKAVTSVFAYVVKAYFHDIPLLEITTWDFENRKRLVKNFMDAGNL